MSYSIHAYDDALQMILDEGEIKSNKRTGIKTKFIPGICSRYDLTESFPLVTRRKIWPKSIWAELLWFISGSTNNNDLNALGAKIWNPWVDEEFEKKHGYAPGSFGPVYGFQLRHFGGYYGNGIGGREHTNDSYVSNHDMRMHYIPEGEYQGETQESLYGKGGFDQLDWMVNRLKEDSSCRRILFSLWNPQDTDRMKLPPCFAPGHKVETDKGYKKIEEIEKGDKVKTHDGSFKNVNQTMATEYQGNLIRLNIRYMPGLPIECTPNHPFLVVSSNSSILKGKWINACDIKPGDFVAIHRTKSNSEYKVFENVVHTNQHGGKKDYTLDKPEDWYMMGYFLGDGWCGKNENRVSFAINDDQVGRILPLIRRSIKISHKPNSITYETKSDKWYSILREFGYLAHNKEIPQWVLQAPDHLLQEFILGYTDADGCIKDRYTHYTTVSQNIALGLQQIFWRLGQRVSVYKQKRSATTIIEGREVSQRDTYNIVVKKSDSPRIYGNRCEFQIEEDYVWLQIKETHVLSNVGTTVYNLSVEDNHTYTVNNIVNHNCHYTYQVMVDDNGDMTGSLTQRSCDFPIGVPANIQFYSALTMMLAQQTGFNAVEFVHYTVDSHIYWDQLEAIEEYLALPTFDCPTLTINKAEDIYSYKLEDFQLSEYECGPKLEIPVAV